MRYRLKALGLHLAASACALSLILGSLYLGWYRWPGWYLTDVVQVVLVMAGVDVVLGPLMTFIIARPTKPRRELARDIAVIVAVQLLALAYGSVSLWNGRPLYYAFSENVLQLVQAYDIDAKEWALGDRQNPMLAPYWYSLPRWIWAPLPQDPQERRKIVGAAITGGDDVISMPRYFKDWDQGLSALRGQLKKVDDVAYFAGSEKKAAQGNHAGRGYSHRSPECHAAHGPRASSAGRVRSRRRQDHVGAASQITGSRYGASEASAPPRQCSPRLMPRSRLRAESVRQGVQERHDVLDVLFVHRRRLAGMAPEGRFDIDIAAVGRRKIVVLLDPSIRRPRIPAFGPPVALGIEAHGIFQAVNRAVVEVHAPGRHIAQRGGAK